MQLITTNTNSRPTMYYELETVELGGGGRNRLGACLAGLSKIEVAWCTTPLRTRTIDRANHQLFHRKGLGGKQMFNYTMFKLK